MTTTAPERNQLEITISQALASHKERIQLEQVQIQSLTQLLKTRQNSNLDNHCNSAIDRLIQLLDVHEKSNGQVYNTLAAFKDAKNIQNLTINKGELAIYLNVELEELARRLGIAGGNDPKKGAAKLLTAAHSKLAWAKLMATHPDPDGYQWQYPSFKFGLYHQHKRKVTGIKMTAPLRDGSTLN